MALLWATGTVMQQAHERAVAKRASRMHAYARVAGVLLDLTRVQRDQRRLQLQRELALQPAFWSKEIEGALALVDLPVGSLRRRELDHIAETLRRAQAVSVERTRLRVAALLDGVADDDGGIARAVAFGVEREEQLELRQKRIALLRSRPAGMSLRRLAWELAAINRRLTWCRKGECCFASLDFDAEPS